MAENILSVTSGVIAPEQYVGTSFDGACIKCKVGEKLFENLGVEGVHDWDPVHAAATVDSALRNPKAEHAKDFEWLDEIMDHVSKANNFHQLGCGVGQVL